MSLTCQHFEMKISQNIYFFPRVSQGPWLEYLFSVFPIYFLIIMYKFPCSFYPFGWLCVGHVKSLFQAFAFPPSSEVYFQFPFCLCLYSFEINKNIYMCVYGIMSFDGDEPQKWLRIQGLAYYVLQTIVCFLIFLKTFYWNVSTPIHLYIIVYGCFLAIMTKWQSWQRLCGPKFFTNWLFKEKNVYP